MEKQKFRLGDQVAWTSQAMGCIRSKSGEIIEVVPAKQCPKSKVKDPGLSRNHVSYVVRASYVDDAGKKRTMNYWPIVKKLELCSTSDEAVPVREPEPPTIEEAEEAETEAELALEPEPELEPTPAKFVAEPSSDPNFKIETIEVRPWPKAEEAEPLFSPEELKGAR